MLTVTVIALCMVTNVLRNGHECHVTITSKPQKLKTDYIIATQIVIYLCIVVVLYIYMLTILYYLSHDFDN